MADARDPRLLWHEAITSFADLATSLTESQWQLPSPCPGWTVGDLVAHTIDIEQLLEGTAPAGPEPDWAALPHVDRDLARRTEPGVDLRRGRDRADVLDELDATVMTRSSVVGAMDLGGTMLSPFGREVPVPFMLRMRIFDIWVHEQDIRTAIGRPGGMSTAAAQASLDLLLDALPKAWAKSAQAPAGSSLLVRVTGPGLECSVLVTVEPDGTGHLADADAAPSTGPSTVTIEADWPTFLAAATGRGPTSALRVSGDPALAEAVLPHLNVAP